MKKIMGFLVLTAVLQCFIMNPALADLIVDTGPGANEHSGYAIDYGHFDTGDQWQYLAAQFSLSQATIVTSVQGWMGSIEAGNVDFVIYANSGSNLPGTELHRSTLYLNQTYDNNPPYYLHAGWYGPSGLTWNFPAGIYWVAFETVDPLFYGAMPNPSPNPLTNEAVWGKDTVASPPYDPGWLAGDLNLGVRIMGDANPVPLPSAAWLLASGLIGTAGIRRRFRKN